MKCLPVKLQVQKMVLVEPSTTSTGSQLCWHCWEGQGETAGKADRKEHPGSYSEPALNTLPCDPMSSVALLPRRRDAG